MEHPHGKWHDHMHDFHLTRHDSNKEEEYVETKSTFYENINGVEVARTISKKKKKVDGVVTGEILDETLNGDGTRKIKKTIINGDKEDVQEFALEKGQ